MARDRSKLEVMKYQCSNCLFTKDRVVSEDRANEIIADCTEDPSSHFTCHVASMEGRDVCCHNFYKKQLNVKMRLAKLWGFAVFVDLRGKDAKKKPHK